MRIDPPLVMAGTRAGREFYRTRRARRLCWVSAAPVTWADECEPPGQQHERAATGGAVGHPLRPEPDRRAAPRECAYRAVQPAARAPPRWPFPAAHRGYRQRAQPRGAHGRTARGPALAWPRMGWRPGPRGRERTVPPVAARRALCALLPAAGGRRRRLPVVLHPARAVAGAPRAAQRRNGAALCRHLPRAAGG